MAPNKTRVLFSVSNTHSACRARYGSRIIDVLLHDSTQEDIFVSQLCSDNERMMPAVRGSTPARKLGAEHYRKMAAARKTRGGVRLGIPAKLNASSGGKPNGIPG